MDSGVPSKAELFVGYSFRAEKLQAQTERSVTQASTQKEALSRIQQGDISCVVSEYSLEDGTGLELLEAIRDDFPELSFILWTGDGSEEIASRAITAGVTDYIVHDGELDGHAVDRIFDRINTLDQAQSEATVLRNQRVFEQLFDTCPTGITILNTDGEIVRANDRAEEILGVSKDEIIDRVFYSSAWEIVNSHGEPIPDEDLPARRAQSTGEAIYGEELGVRRPDGEHTWLLVNSIPITDADDGSTGPSVVNKFEDVTRLKQQAKRSAESERKFRAVFEEAFDAMLIADDDTEYVDVNPAACDLFGLSREELLGRSIAEFAAEDYDFEGAWQTFQESEQDRGLFPLVRADGEERLVEFAATPDILPGRHLSVLRDVTDREEAKEQLQEERDRAQRYLDTAGVMMVALDADGEVTLANDRVCDVLGHEESDIVGQDWFDTFVPESDRAETRAGFEELMAGNIDPVEQFENPVVTADGNERTIEWYNTVLRDDEDKITGTLSSGTDITERKKHEANLQLFRNLVDHSLDGINAVDPETAEILEANEASCRMLGYDRSELLSLTVPDINPEFSMDMWDEFVESVKEEGQKVIESTHQRKDGSTFPVEISLTRASLDSEYHVAAVRDITKRKQREQELKASEEKFRSLIETAPDPIFVADTETGEIVETNTAACQIRKQSRDEIIGLHQTALHPEEDADRYKALFERHIKEAGTISRFPDGSQIFLSTADGEQIPVAISAQTVHLADRTLMHGIFRDVSDQQRYERSLEELNRAAQDFLAAETDHEIAQTTADIATEVLDLYGAAVYFYDETEGILTPVAYPAAAEELLGELPTFSPGDSIAWRVYSTQEQAMLDDVRSDDDVYNPGTPIRSELVVPLGNHGVFIAGDPKIGAFDSQTAELVDILTTTAEAALNRIDWARELHEQERESKRQAQRLERVNQINEKIRSIIRAIVHAETRQEIEQSVCDALSEIDRFTFAWIGTPDFVASELSPSSWAGTESRYLESISLDLDSDDGNPSLNAVKQQETTVVSNIAGSVQRASWRQDALLEGYRSVISLPILHEEVLYGVLAIYGSQSATFDDLSTAVLTDLGELIGYALNAVEQRSAFRDRSVVELTFELPPELDDSFFTLASELGSDLEIRNITPRPDGSYVVYLLSRDVDPDRFTNEVRNSPIVSEIRSIGDAERGRFELIVSESCVVSDIAAVAPNFHSITILEQAGRISIVIPQDRDVRSFIAQFHDQYEDLTLVGRQATDIESSLGPPSLLDKLTRRQQQVLKAAYYNGFFDQPRKSTGTEIAESLGISQPAFSKQLRNAERKLLKPLYEPE